MKKKTSLCVIFLLVCTLLFAVSLTLYVFSLTSYTLADSIDAHVGHPLRVLLSRLSSRIAFSLGELILTLLPILVALLLWRLFRRFYDVRVRRGTLAFVLGAVLLVFSMFFLVIGVSYQTTPLEQELSLSREPVSTEELETTARILLTMAERELDAITFTESGSSVMPYDLDTLSLHLERAYESLSAEYGFIPIVSSRVKGITLSVPMSYMHLLGIYFFFTGEPNINMDYPDVERPFTALHELAHQRGVAREDEASMVAFLAGIRSDDAYVRYCSAIGVYRYVANALYSADSERDFSLVSDMDSRIRGELVALNEHQRKYAGNPIGEISSELNDVYLKANGTEGEVSYGLVVDLAVAYLKNDLQ